MVFRTHVGGGSGKSASPPPTVTTPNTPAVTTKIGLPIPSSTCFYPDMVSDWMSLPLLNKFSECLPAIKKKVD